MIKNISYFRDNSVIFIVPIGKKDCELDVGLRDNFGCSRSKFKSVRLLDSYMIGVQTGVSNKAIFTRIVWHVAPSCWNHIFSKYSSIIGKKKSVII